MRHRYPETLRRTPTPMMVGSFSTPSLNKQSQDAAANWFQRRKQNQQNEEQERKGSFSTQRNINEIRSENINRAQTAPAKPKSEESNLVKSTQDSMWNQDHSQVELGTCPQEIERPSTGKLVRQCLKCKVLYTTSHFCPRHSASTPTLLQPLPPPLPVSIRKKKLTNGTILRANPYTRYRTTPDPLKK
jgi:hypothetical protein